MSNRNLRDAYILVTAMWRAGLRHVVIAPGSRHTPLVFAFSRVEQFERILAHDERSAAFFALGIAARISAPVAVVCTSGTAGANMYPAVIEAHQSNVPLIVLTADRPHELRYSGANQTIDQINLFGHYARWHVDLPLPEQTPEESQVRYLMALGVRAVYEASSQPAGVVHLNAPYRKPLEPTDVPADAPLEQYTETIDQFMLSMHRPLLSVEPATIDAIAGLVSQYRDGLIVCGPATNRSGNQQINQALERLQQATGYSVMADVASGLRFSLNADMACYDTFLRDRTVPRPDIVIRFGQVPTSKALNSYLDSDTIQVSVQVSDSCVWHDDIYRTSHFITADTVGFVDGLLKRLDENYSSPVPVSETESDFATHLTMLGSLAHQALDLAFSQTDTHRLTDFHAAQYLFEHVTKQSDDMTIFLGNSLAVRHADQFAVGTNANIRVMANRGASGIDGNISTAIGFAAASDDRACINIALLGDTTLYHDMNGLLALRDGTTSVIFIVINNGGGGIFHRLPVSQHQPEFDEYFIAPHGLTFEHTAHLYGLQYSCVDNLESFRYALTQAIETQRRSVSILLEVTTDHVQDNMLYQQLMHHVTRQIADGSVLQKPD